MPHYTFVVCYCWSLFDILFSLSSKCCPFNFMLNFFGRKKHWFESFSLRSSLIYEWMCEKFLFIQKREAQAPVMIKDSLTTTPSTLLHMKNTSYLLWNLLEYISWNLTLWTIFLQTVSWENNRSGNFSSEPCRRM